MKQASIPLSPSVASLYLNADLRKRKKAEQIVNRLLPEILHSRKKGVEELFKTMDEVSRIAKANGLTPEILEEILQEIKSERKNERA